MHTTTETNLGCSKCDGIYNLIEEKELIEGLVDGDYAWSTVYHYFECNKCGHQWTDYGLYEETEEEA